MATYKLILDQRRSKANGKYPIIVRITVARKSRGSFTKSKIVGLSSWFSVVVFSIKGCLFFDDSNL